MPRIYEKKDGIKCRYCGGAITSLKYLSTTIIRETTADVHLGACEKCWQENIIYIKK